MYKLAVFDLDGTLLNKKNEISDANMEALSLLEDSGCEIILATGRPDILAKEYFKKLNLKVPMIACNGAVLRNPFTNEEYLNQTLAEKLLLDVLEICIRDKHHFMIYTPNLIIGSANRKIKYFEKRNLKLADECKVALMILNDVEDILNIVSEYQVNKVLILEDDPKEFEKLPDKLKDFKKITFCQSNVGHMDIMLEGVSKKNALHILAKSKGIESKDIVVFGDNHNDLEMMKYGGCAITMDNAVDEVKAIADYISKHHDLDGVAHAIKEFILG